MIVKNEEKIIKRCLDSVLPFMDCFCICDTGSTDKTISIIQDWQQENNMDGKIYCEPFQDFEYNRNWILEKAKGMSDFVLLMDADMILINTHFSKTTLCKDNYYQIYQGTDSFSYLNTRIIPNNVSSIKYIGVTHEYLSVPSSLQKVIIIKEDLFISDWGDGGCKENKFKRDIELLEKSLEKDQYNPRTMFYLANSYYDSGQYKEALSFYLKRIELKSWNEEVWYCYYRIGFIYKSWNQNSKAIENWINCITFNSHRIENIYEIVKLYRLDCKYQIANSFYQMAYSMISSDPTVYKQCLFFHNRIYNYELDYEYTIIAFYNNIRNVQKYVVNIMNHCEHYTRNLLSNQKFYDNYISPRKIHNYTDTVKVNVNEKKILFYSSSSCMVPKQNGYLMCVRYVNYKIQPNGSYDYEKHIISVYKLLWLNENFEIQSERMINFPSKKECKEQIFIGVEDVKLFPFDNKIFTIGTFVDSSLHTGKYECQIGCGTIDSEKDETFSVTKVQSTFSLQSCEKNWVYTIYNEKLSIIYQWYPLQICSFENGIISLKKETPMPLFFKTVRGSSCGFQYKNEIWFVTHIVSHESPRYYYHILVVFDTEMKLLRYTAPLKLSKKSIEFCLSIIVKEDIIVIPFSSFDSTTEIGIYDKSYIETLFFPNENKN